MTQIDHKRIMLGNEGHVIEFAGNHGEPAASEYARAAIDGLFNALVRLEKPEEVAAFAFALADRVVGRVKAPTAWLSPKPDPIAVLGNIIETEAPARARPPKSEPRRYGYWTIFWIGWLCAAIPAAVVLANLTKGFP